MMDSGFEFSNRSRAETLRRFQTEKFDLLIIGGGITGAAAARDAVSRGLKVALVEKNDFASGTSSASSKLIHGGLRYLQNMELGLVFEALSERTRLLDSAPHMVHELPFLLPIYEGDSKGPSIIGFGLWLYDLLALFRAPGFHKRLSKGTTLNEIPFLKKEGLKCSFRYYDARMWDDVLAVETVRSAFYGGAAVANYVEALDPLWKGSRICGFRVKDCESKDPHARIEIQASQVIICAGPWTDLVGPRLTPNWIPWLNPSKGVHIIFDLKKIPIKDALVMSHPTDGRIAFVIPRPDFGSGVVIVGTTDGPTPAKPEKASITKEDVEYLMLLLRRYFPGLSLTEADILSAYVGVRPLMGARASTAGSEGLAGGEEVMMSLQKVSREHFIGKGPGKTVVVAGGKYTTHRTMAKEIIDFSVRTWKQDARNAECDPVPSHLGKSRTKSAVNPRATKQAMDAAVERAKSRGIKIPQELLDRYGSEAVEIIDLNPAALSDKNRNDPEGFPLLDLQLRYLMRTGLVVHLEDFYFRRVPLFLSRKDHGLPWLNILATVWAEEVGIDPEKPAGKKAIEQEKDRLLKEFAKRDSWMSHFSIKPPVDEFHSPNYENL